MLMKGRPDIKVLDRSSCEKKIVSELNIYIIFRIENLYHLQNRTFILLSESNNFTIIKHGNHTTRI